MKIGGKNVSNTLYIGGQRPFTSADKSNLDKNTSARHEHSNKSVLDGITEEKVSQWDAGGGTVDVSGKEDKSNKVQSLSDTSTGEQYPSAKATVDYVKQMVGNKDKFEIGITLDVDNEGIYSTSNPTHTYEDIKQAYDDGKDVYLLTGGLAGNNRMPIVAVNDMSIEFGLTMGNNYVTIGCDSVNTWITTTHTFASEDEVADILSGQINVGYMTINPTGRINTPAIYMTDVNGDWSGLIQYGENGNEITMEQTLEIGRAHV